MYEIINGLHAWNRWFITIMLLVVLYKSFTGWKKRSVFEKADNTMSLVLMILCDLQLLGGLILYIWLSPQTQAAFNDFGAAMKNSASRFWAVEHIFGMVIAWLLIHIGRSKSKKAATDEMKHKKLFIFTLIAFLIIMATIPWPGTAANRALLPF